jgi:hypothetical protein
LGHPIPNPIPVGRGSQLFVFGFDLANWLSAKG